MKKHEDFMRIELSKSEAIEIFSGIGFKYDECKNWMPYSKIVLQFNSESEYEKFEEDEENDINEFVTYTEFYYEKMKMIMYADDKYSFAGLTEMFSLYDCDIYQFIIENPN